MAARTAPCPFRSLIRLSAATPALVPVRKGHSMDPEFGTSDALSIAVRRARAGVGDPQDHDLGAFAEQLALAETIDDAERALGAALRALGFAKFAYVNLGQRQIETVTQKQFSNELVVSTDFSLDWRLRYRERRYYNTDPVLFVCRTRMIPVTWADLEASRDLPGDRGVFADARAMGMRSGFTVPIHTPAGDSAMVSLASPERPAVLQRVLGEYQHNIHLMAFLYHECLERLSRADAPEWSLQG